MSLLSFVAETGVSLVTLLFFLLGVLLLTFGANCLVQGSAAIADVFNIPKHIIGLTLVALGTSAPELFVNLIAAFHGDTAFALSNVSGSNLANLCIGLGLCVFVGAVPLRKSEFGLDLMLLWLIPVILICLFYSTPDRALPWVAILPLSLTLIFYLWTLKSRSAGVEEQEALEPAQQNLTRGIVEFCVGVAALYFGGDWVLHAAQSAARWLGIGDDVIALTVVAVATSVPDITASVVAAIKKEFGIAVGNILGSNISNLVLVLNSTILVSGQSLATTPGIRSDYVAVAMVSMFVFGFGWLSDRLPRQSWWVLLATYVVYLVTRVWLTC